MNKQRLEQILQILIMPYTESEFLSAEKDFIRENRYAFYQLRYESKHLTRDAYEKKYYISERKISAFFQKHDEYRIKNLDDIKLLLEMFYPEEEIVNAMKETAGTSNRTIEGCMDRVYMSNISEMASSLLTFRDGKIAIRTWFNQGKDIFDYPSVFDKVEVWNHLGRLMTIDIIIAAFFVLCELRDEYNLFNQSGTIMLADKTLEQVFRKGLAETHLHFNAGVDFQYLWQHRMNPISWKDEKTRKSFLESSKIDLCGLAVMVYRICWAEYLERGEGIGFQDYIEKQFYDNSEMICCLLRSLKNGTTDLLSKNVEENWGQYSVLIDSFFSRFRDKEPGKGGWLKGIDDFLLQTVFSSYRLYHTSGELILLFKSLWYFETQQYSEEELHLFLQYVRCKNLFYGAIVRLRMVEGLSNFRNAYSNMSRELYSIQNRNEQINVIFKSICQNVYLKKLEVRLAPPMRFQNIGSNYLNNVSVQEDIKREYLESVVQILEAFRASMLESGKISPVVHDREVYENALDIPYQENRLAIPTLGIVFHFIKSNHVDNKVGDSCWIAENDRDAPAYKNIIAMRRAMTISAEALEELRSSIPLLAEYVVGLDAASEENVAEPWIFAPVFKAVRRKGLTKAVVKDSGNSIRRVNNMGFTYHVGEEFRHILSGLRHVDEVVNEFQYKAGDRLGHALSLGIDVNYWISRNEAVVLPLLEYLEDLIWLWGKRVHSSWGTTLQVEALEGLILKYVKEALGDIHGLTVPVIYDAYRMKFKRNYEKIFEKNRKLIFKPDDKEDKLFSEQYQEDHFCRFYSVKSPYGFMWTAEKLFCTLFCPAFYNNYHHPIIVHVDREKAELYSEIQKLVIREVEQKGIYIETNPTSNLAIGELNSLRELSIVNLNSRGLVNEKNVVNEILATINSDNPVIFNTNCENEHAYVYHALTYRGYPKERVLMWIDKVRQMGLDSSFVKTIKKPSVQLSEIDELLSILKNKLHIVEP